ncbi:hypothetical protein J4H92_02015 [Leucobacter weissii]|uniref:Uncharacterized protein n=1 Tax=Leucobacter weissii TaxID=1983706 RepID=A0A939MKY1_9MICO|nr:hypothetical protein [Leucobacter weissii]
MPRYGELAPTEDQGTPVSGSSPDAPEPSTQRPAGAPGGAQPVPGVPHNLGASGSPSATRSPVSPPSDSPATPPDPARQPYAPAEGAAARVSGGRRADRIITILLLVFATFGALYSAFSLNQLPSTLTLLGSVLEVEGFTVPSSVGTLGTVGALAIFALYAVTLISSIQRLRARKIAFWVPLTAGVIAFVVTFSLTAVALNQAPELIQVLTDPDSTAKLLEYLSSPTP